MGAALLCLCHGAATGWSCFSPAPCCCGNRSSPTGPPIMSRPAVLSHLHCAAAGRVPCWRAALLCLCAAPGWSCFPPAPCCCGNRGSSTDRPDMPCPAVLSHLHCAAAVGVPCWRAALLYLCAAPGWSSFPPAPCCCGNRGSSTGPPAVSCPAVLLHLHCAAARGVPCWRAALLCLCADPGWCCFPSVPCGCGIRDSSTGPRSCAAVPSIRSVLLLGVCCLWGLPCCVLLPDGVASVLFMLLGTVCLSRWSTCTVLRYCCSCRV